MLSLHDPVDGGHVALFLEGLVLGMDAVNEAFSVCSDKLCFSNEGLPRLSPQKTCDLSETRFRFLEVNVLVILLNKMIQRSLPPTGSQIC